MAKREGFTVTRKLAADSPASPNAVVPEITIEIRVHWPAGMGHEDAVHLELLKAMVESKTAIRVRTRPATEVERAAEQREADGKTIERLRANRAQRRTVTDGDALMERVRRGQVSVYADGEIANN